jgi:hypothetical protein
LGSISTFAEINDFPHYRDTYCATVMTHHVQEKI